MKDCTDSNLRFLAAAIAECLMTDLSTDEIRKLYAIILLIGYNIQASITLRTLVIVPSASSTVLPRPSTNPDSKNSNSKSK